MLVERVLAQRLELLRELATPGREVPRVFQVPRAETLAVTWLGAPEQALIYGWPAELGPFGGIGAVRVGDSLAGAILFDERLGVQVRPGVTARFIAGRARE